MELKNTVLGLELGSTRIKAVLLDENHLPIASGSYDWENQLVDGIWTYGMNEIRAGVQVCFARLVADVEAKFGQKLTTVGAIGISGMMHGYLPFDAEGNQLAEFRTWRNTITGQAASILSKEFGFNIPQRWSIAHLYQAILNNEGHFSAPFLSPTCLLFLFRSQAIAQRDFTASSIFGKTSLQSPSIATSLIAKIGAVGSWLTEMICFARFIPIVCCREPDTPKQMHTSGAMVFPVWPICSSTGAQPSSTAFLVAPTTAPIWSASSNNVLNPSLPAPYPPIKTKLASSTSPYTLSFSMRLILVTRKDCKSKSISTLRTRMTLVDVFFLIPNTLGRTEAICGRWSGVTIDAITFPPYVGLT